MSKKEKVLSHREICELWRGVEIPPNAGRATWRLMMARDISEHLNGARVSYHTVHRWWERDSIPIQYHEAVIRATKKRRFGVNITFESLSSVKAEEHFPSREVV